MFELHITETGKSFSPKAKYSIFNQERKSGFSDMREIYQYLRERYGSARRQPMYIDRKDGGTIKCGWVIGFRNSAASHAPVEHWLQQDWISIKRVETVSL